ncbi:hypothetical protein AT959_12275 [Dechloromonas denitrificans]|uniref:Polysaccharide biosynthesis protein n=1 Tax=Dechloromonas denitrificans TaxID=281362 RepID=A0A133XGT1_9RHOO|nr:hypothetical protein AT959_12275 [Dechloromonas denitrificans]
MVAIPVLVAQLGVERFGLLSLAWLLVGYFSLFDFGLGRALTRLVAVRLSSGLEYEIPDLTATAMGLIRSLGLAAGVLLATLSTWVVGWLAISAALSDEVLVGLWVLAGALPFVLLSAGWRGVLEAYGRFDLVNWIRIPLGVALFLAPLVALWFSKGLVPVIVSLAVTRVLGWWFLRFMCFRLRPDLRRANGFSRALVWPLLTFGGWMTVSNVVGPLMVYADRFLIGGLLSATAVAYYATPYEMVTRLWIISGALTGVLFPIVAARLVADREMVRLVYWQSMKCVFMLFLPVVAILYLFAGEVIDWWLGADFARNGQQTARLLLLGVFVNALGQVAITVVHGAGRADWAAKIHLLELPFYLAALVLMAECHGIEGVALVWLLRVAVDTVLMAILVERLLTVTNRYLFVLTTLSAGVILLLWLAGGVENLAARGAVALVMCLACAMLLPRQLRGLVQVSRGSV